ncbi:AAA family ATPase [Pseudomonas zeae]|uniref:AAA family ATPase n=1 Tax=Pseudomonas zeae TaxID=2745510 RepID=UPI0039DFDF34
MKIISLWVDGYKNLVDTHIGFRDNEIPTAVIGNNGTGKSNLIEALLSIFIGLYFGEPPRFRFELLYEAHGKNVKITKHSIDGSFTVVVDNIEWTRAAFRRRIHSSSLMPPFPAMIFGYYSGTCERLKNQFKRYGRTYSTKLRKQSDDLDKFFNFSDIDQAKFILLSVLSDRNSALLSDISISSLDRLSITIRPSNRYNPNQDEPKFWGAQGAILGFLADLDNWAIDSSSSRVSSGDETLDLEYERKYTLNQQGLEKLGGSSASRRGANISIMLQALKTKSMLVAVDYTLKHINGISTFNFEELSEGEKQLISVIGALHISEKNECLVLLDEPDTHLNPAWTWRYSSLLKNALGSEQSNSSTVLIATHNPVLISGLTKNQVLIAHSKNGQLTYDYPYRDPRGQGVANVLTSEFFGLPSSLDEHTQSLIDERLFLAYKKERLTIVEAMRLKEINSRLDMLGLTISFRDDNYKKFEESIYNNGQ